MAHEVVNVGHDRTQLAALATQAKENLKAKKLRVVADRGYFKGEELKACEEAKIETYVPKPQTSNSQARGLFGKRDFIYRPEEDEYECPAGERAIYRFTQEEDGQQIRRYWSSACPRCSLKSKCTTNKNRRISRGEHEDVIERVQARLDQHPEMMRLRRQTAEHPFGTIKGWAGPQHFKMKTLKHVNTELSLHVLAYNLKRLINVFGVPKFIQQMQAA